MAKQFEPEKVQETEEGRITELRLPTGWNKQHIKTYSEGLHIRHRKI